MGKLGLGSVAKGYIETLHRGRDGGVHKLDIIVQIIAPILCGIALASFGGPLLSLGKSALPNAVVAVSIVSALMCALAVMVFQLRMQAAQGEDSMTRDELRFIDEFFSDVLWAIVIGFASVVLMVGAGADADVPEVLLRVAAGAALAALLNFGMVTCMCIKRLNAAYKIMSKARAANR